MADQEALIANKRAFLDLIDKDFSGGTYKEKIKTLIENEKTRLLLNLNDLRDFDSALTTRFIRSPTQFIPAFEESLHEVIDTIHPTFLLDAGYNCRLGITGSFGRNHVTPRTLGANFVGQLVCVEGIVTRCSVIHPKAAKTVHYCPSTNVFYEKSYRDVTSMAGPPTSYIYPQKDANNNRLETEFGLCTYRDTQTLSIQEMPERAPAGQLPRSIDVILEDDLVDTVKPGDRVRIVGVYRALARKNLGPSVSGAMRTTLLANNIIMLGKHQQQPKMTPSDIRHVRELSKKKNVFSVLARSIAPSIYGHDNIKKSLLLTLLGGQEKNFSNGTHIRGDINILLVGDPGTAKSQLLRFMLHISPLAISTSGRASTGVGLTAAVVSDPDSGDRTLQAGAMVLADRGVVCVDEFDKMSDQDRVAMHEVMEQQTVTIAKAGVHTALNARCSVVSAANPIYGQYNPSIPVQRNVGLPDSLLSRFDLLFIVLDVRDSQRDRHIAQHVLNVHMHRGSESQGDNILSGNHHDDLYIADALMEDADSDMLSLTSGTQSSQSDAEKPIYESTAVYRQNLENSGEGSARSRRKKRAQEDNVIPPDQIVSIEFLRKYVYFAKNRTEPELSDDAMNLISQKYCQLRKNDSQKSLPVTPRTLETLIRLATAHAKCRLSQEVTEDDVEEVFKILEYAISFMTDTESAADSLSGNKRKRADEPSSESLGGEETHLFEEIRKSRTRKRRRMANRNRSNDSNEPQTNEDTVDTSSKESDGEGEDSGPTTETMTTNISDHRISHVRHVLSHIFDDCIEFDDLMDQVNHEVSVTERYQPSEVESILRTLEQENKVQYSDGMIFKI